VLALVMCLAPVLSHARSPERIEQGRYLFDAAGCLGCHTDTKNKGAPLAGGRELKTPFGIFYSPNITPDPDFGIGKWSDADFLRAIRRGINPAGENYFPVFPYPTFTRMTDADILDIKAYIFSRPPVANPNRQHEAGPIFGSRLLVSGWKLLNFNIGPLSMLPDMGTTWNRGAYLVEALGHCRECHTPRDFLGGFRKHNHLAGTKQGPEGGIVPNITPDKETGIGKWPDSDLKALFSMGMLPDGDFVGGGMAEFVTNTSSKWTKQDLKSVIIYLRSLQPVRNQVKTKKKSSDDEWN